MCDSEVWLPRSPLSSYPSAPSGAPAPSLQPPPSSENPALEIPKASTLPARRVWGLPSPGCSPLIRRIPVDRLQAEPRHQPPKTQQQQGPDSHAPRPRMGGPHDPAKAWGAGHQLPQSRSPPGVTALAAPAILTRPPGWLMPPAPTRTRFLLCPRAQLWGAQPARALPGAVCGRPTPRPWLQHPGIGERA